MAGLACGVGVCPQEEAVPRAIVWTVAAVGITGYGLIVTLTAVQVGQAGHGSTVHGTVRRWS